MRDVVCALLMSRAILIVPTDGVYSAVSGYATTISGYGGMIIRKRAIGIGQPLLTYHYTLRSDFSRRFLCY